MYERINPRIASHYPIDRDLQVHACMRHLRKQYTTLHHDSRLGDAFIRDEQRQTGGQDPPL